MYSSGAFKPISGFDMYNDTEQASSCSIGPRHQSLGTSERRRIGMHHPKIEKD